MDPFSMVVAIVFIGCVTGIAHSLIESRVKIAKARGVENDAVAGELRALREEVRQLREQHADAILSFDTTLRHLGSPAAPPAPRAEVRTGVEQ